MPGPVFEEGGIGNLGTQKLQPFVGGSGPRLLRRAELVGHWERPRQEVNDSNNRHRSATHCSQVGDMERAAVDDQGSRQSMADLSIGVGFFERASSFSQAG
jgi:hypothetical protein